MYLLAHVGPISSLLTPLREVQHITIKGVASGLQAKEIGDLSYSFIKTPARHSLYYFATVSICLTVQSALYVPDRSGLLQAAQQMLCMPLLQELLWLLMANPPLSNMTACHHYPSCSPNQESVAFFIMPRNSLHGMEHQILGHITTILPENRNRSCSCTNFALMRVSRTSMPGYAKENSQVLTQLLP